MKKWARAYFSYSLYKFITTKQQLHNNAPGRQFFFLASDGTVFPSVVHNNPMGNLNEVETFRELWYGKKAEDARKEVDRNNHQAWMICTARSAIRKHPLRVGAWVLRSKFGQVDLE